ncbi:molybdopterin-binding protein [Sellimonas sp.]|uniref:molybdopterin-binding protein n=1 Tax=Sellimonas sp. TaxID=2021466 RepID=UPI00257E50E0|nr:molybdopterin-binding protein [Sellimonas sp.]
MKLIRTEDAKGCILCHDITQIIKDEKKGPVFRKGHVVTEEDIPVLLSVGKEHLYVWEKEEGMLHEDEGAEILRKICQGGSAEEAAFDGVEKTFRYMKATEAKEGKIELISDVDGLFKVNSDALRAVNRFGQMMIATRHGNTEVKAGDKLAGTRIIPLVIEEKKMQDVEKAAMELTGGEPVLKILPFQKKKAAVVTTGSEVYKGRIRDTFTPVLLEKLSKYDVEIIGHKVCDDDHEMVTMTIQHFLEQGADIVLCTGGMSVDPDDRTPLAIKNTGADIVTYGAPVLPGAMFMLAYTKEKKAILGLPGCVMYAKRTIFDIVLPRILADDEIAQEELADLGEGGLCLGCPVCTYPNCGFGK